MAHNTRQRKAQRLHEAAWSDMFANLQTAYAELTRARFELERRAAEIEATRNLFQQVIESMTEALFLIDHSGHVVQTNPAARTLLERSEAELVGRPFSEVSGTRELPATVSQLLERTPTGTLDNLEVAIQTRSGSTRPISASCGLVRDKRGKIIGMLVLASDVTERKWAMEKARLWEELQQKEGLRGRLLEQVIHAQEEERKRVARELHDDVCQSLTGLIMALGAVQASLTQSAGRARRILDDTTLLANNTLTGVRRMIADLRPRVLDDLGLVPALHRLAHDLHERAGVAVNIDAAAVPDRLPPLVETVLFRIAQEALTNVRKHAHAQRTTITLIVDRGRVILLVNDDGVGFQGIEAGVPKDDTHTLGIRNGECGCLGLIGMRERAALLGGTFLVQSTQGQGTTVHVELPLEAV